MEFPPYPTKEIVILVGLSWIRKKQQLDLMFVVLSNHKQVLNRTNVVVVFVPVLSGSLLSGPGLCRSLVLV